MHGHWMEDLEEGKRMDGSLTNQRRIYVQPSMRRIHLYEANRRGRDDGNDFNRTENSQFQEQQYVSDAIAEYVWKQLKQVSIPVFDGIKKNFNN